MPTYIICRDTQSVNSNELLFWPPKDSDELFDALRMKYPHLRQHSERMGQAVIDFFMEEQITQLSTPLTANSTLASPWEMSMQSMSSDASTWSSPELFDLATPTFSPQPQPVALSRQQSTATNMTTPSNGSPPAIEQMTGVFSLTDANQPKQRVRRKMTEQEKVEYRKRRIAKACDKCSKRKRKCNHNQPEVESVGPSKVQKVTKPTPAQVSRKAPPLIDPQIHQGDLAFEAGAMNFDTTFDSELNMAQLGDYSTLFEDPAPDMSFDNLFMQQDQQWPWSDMPDFTLMDSSQESLHQDMNQAPQLNQHVPGHGGTDYFQQNVGGFGDMTNFDMMQITGGGEDHSGMLWEHLRTGQEDQPTEKQQPTHTPHVHGIDEKAMFEFDTKYTARDQHAKNAAMNAKSATIAKNANIAKQQFAQHQQQNSIQTASGVSAPCDSLSQMTLRLTGTAKAVKAFGNLLPSHSSSKPRLQSVSLKKVALLALGGFSMAQDLQRHQSGSLQRVPCEHARCAASGVSFVRQSDLERHTMQQHRQDQITPPSPWLDFLRQNMVSSSPMHDLAIGQQAVKNALAPQEDESEAVSRTVTRPGDPESATASSNHELMNSLMDGSWSRRRWVVQEASLSARASGRYGSDNATSIEPVSDQALAGLERDVNSKVQTHQSRSQSGEDKMKHDLNVDHQQKRHIPSLGEGLSSSSSPSTELYLLKRRIPKALHSVVDRNSPSATLGPLLQTIPNENAGMLRQASSLGFNKPERTTVKMNLPDGDAKLASLSAEKNLARTGGLGAAMSSAQPVHAFPRPRVSVGNDTAVGSTLGLGHNSSLAVNAPQSIWTFQAGTPAASTSTSGLSSTGASATLNLAKVYRLEDHVRRRDHFGRLSRSNLVAGCMFTLAAFATLALLQFANFAPGTLSLLLLAFISPVSEVNRAAAASMGSGHCQKEDRDAPRDIIENESWHTALLRSACNSRPSRAHLRQLLFAESESGSMKGGRCSWQGFLSVVV